MSELNLDKVFQVLDRRMEEITAQLETFTEEEREAFKELLRERLSAC